MSINYIGSSGLAQISHLKTTGTNDAKKKGEVDPPVFSSVLKEADLSAGAGNGILAQRAQKVAMLKQQVETGSYQPDLRQVASSLANFLLEGE